MRFAFAILAFLASAPAMGQTWVQNETQMTTAATEPNGCPVDKPIAKRITSQWKQCTLLACAPKLVCPSDPVSKGMLGGADCYYSQINDCNTCTSDITMQCFSEQELQGAIR